MSIAKKDEDSGLSSYYNNKTTIIQEARLFNESPINPRKCRALLTRIVYLFFVGESFGTQEATNLFFGTTRLFQHKDSGLRQMVYLAIKELATTAEDVIMVTQSIMKDMQQPNSEVIYRPNAIRALCTIIDPSMAQGVERYFKAAIVDKNPSISSAALVSAYHLFPHAKDAVRRWVNEVQEAVAGKIAPSFYSSSPSSSYLGFGGSSSNSSSGYQAMPSTSYITQYHALGLLFSMRQQDRMAITKMVQQLGGGKSGAGTTLKNPMALCMLIRYAAKIMEEDPNLQRSMLDLIEGWLRHKSDMVNLEAARTICEMKNASPSQLKASVQVLQHFLSSSKQVLKFSATRTLASLALSHPDVVSTCNVDLENLIADTNRSVATYAITTLLKTGNEASVDRLMKQISGFMSEISDEFKVIIVDAIRSLCLKFPSTHVAMLGFLSSVLREEGGYDFKRAVVEAMLDMIQFIAECKEQALAYLCEFIEDCEFTKLSVRILHLLGLEGPKMPQPTKYIRFIYNRVVLENATVRAAAVASLAKFGLNSGDNSLRKSVGVLLNRCLEDADDEVRDRAALYLRSFKETVLANTYAKGESVFSLATLESKLVTYVSDPSSSSKPFDIAAVPKISRAQAAAESARPSVLDSIGVAPTTKTTSSEPPPPTAAERQSQFTSQLAEVDEFAPFGAVLNSSTKVAQLTESETEYQVTCVKHIFQEHIVFQFNISNTIPDTVLEDVVVQMQTPEDAGVTEMFTLPSLSVTSESPGLVYVAYSRDDPEEYPMASFPCTLKFVSKEQDPETGEPEEEGYADEYQLEELELSAGGDYIIPTYASFNTEWEKMASLSSQTETFSLSDMDGLKTACDSIVELLNMEALGGSATPSSTSVHTLQLSGLVSGSGGKVLVRCRMTYASGQGVTLEVSTRGQSAGACQLVLSAIGG